MKLLLTHGYFLEQDEKEKAIMKPYPPLGILSIAAFLDQHQIENKVYDSTFGTENGLLKSVEEFKPDAIGFYVNLMTRANVIKLAKIIKNKFPNIFLFAGGPETRHYAASFLKNNFDLVVLGEGEQTCLEICNYLNEIKNKHRVPNGTAVIINNEIVFGEERALIKSMDDLPVPARNKIDLNKYLNIWKNAHGYSMINMSTMRGCPYTCKWCSRAVYGGTYRRKSSECVANEIELLQKNYAFDKIWFVDDVFTISHKWLESFAKVIRERKIIFSYEIITRADRLNDECIQLLKQSGCFRIWIGAESGSQAIIDAMDRRVDVQRVQEMIIKCKNAGIETGTFIMLGYPGETLNDISLTKEHLIKSNPDWYTLTVAYPIKGTTLFSEIENKINYLPVWEVSSDREIEFERKYKRKFYDWAIRYVNNAVEANKNKSSLVKWLKHKIKERIAFIFLRMQQN